MILTVIINRGVQIEAHSFSPGKAGTEPLKEGTLGRQCNYFYMCLVTLTLILLTWRIG
jgi:hypothetical protein